MLKEKKNLSSLQLFRGLAAVLVILHHTTTILKLSTGKEFLLGIFEPFGSHGVDFFFVLSGFIILYAHYNDIGKANLGLYFKKRFVRIYPLYWIIVIPLIPMLFLFPAIGAQGNETDLSVIINSVLLIPNETPPFLGVAWTLTHEIKFYLIFGLSIILLKPKYSFPLILIWSLISLAQFAKVVNFNDGFYLKFIFSGYNLEFILGMIAAYLFINYKPRFNWVIVIVGAIGFILAGINGELKIMPIDSVITYGLSAFLLILGSARLDSESKVKIPKVFLYLGEASYSIYLTHYPVIVVLFKVFTVIGLGESILLYVIPLIALIVGCLFHTIIEKPLLKFFRNKTSVQKVDFNKELVRPISVSSDLK
jgi:exopolysaccharide production protein ExoZ